jgi:hypothetical protein
MEAMDIEIAVQYRHNGRPVLRRRWSGPGSSTLTSGGHAGPGCTSGWSGRAARSSKMADEAARKKAWREAHGGAEVHRERTSARLCARLVQRNVQGQSADNGEAPILTDFQHRQDKTSQDKTRPDQF